jgi:hypothetical protein
MADAFTKGSSSLAKFNRVASGIAQSNNASMSINPSGAIAVGSSGSGYNGSRDSNGNLSIGSSGGGGGGSSSAGSTSSVKTYNGRTYDTKTTGGSLVDFYVKATPQGKILNPAYMDNLMADRSHGNISYVTNIPTYIDAPKAATTPTPAPTPKPVLTTPLKPTTTVQPSASAAKPTNTNLISSASGKPLTLGNTALAKYNREVQAQAKSQGKDTMLNTSTGALSVKPNAVDNSLVRDAAQVLNAKQTAANKAAAAKEAAKTTQVAPRTTPQQNTAYQAKLAGSSGTTVKQSQPVAKQPQSAGTKTVAKTSSDGGIGDWEAKTSLGIVGAVTNAVKQLTSPAPTSKAQQLQSPKLTVNPSSTSTALGKMVTNGGSLLGTSLLNTGNKSNFSTATPTQKTGSVGDDGIGKAASNLSLAIAGGVKSVLTNQNLGSTPKVAPQSQTSKQLTTGSGSTLLGNLVTGGAKSNFSTATRTTKTGTAGGGDYGIGNASKNLPSAAALAVKNQNLGGSSLSSTARNAVMQSMKGTGSLQNIPNTILNKGDMSGVHVNQIQKNLNSITGNEAKDANLVNAKKDISSAQAAKTDSQKQYFLASAKSDLSRFANR